MKVEKGEFHDFEIEYSGDPAALDKTLQALGLAVIVQGEKVNGHYVMRVFGNPGYIKFACEHQGYCRIVAEIPQSPKSRA